MTDTQNKLQVPPYPVRKRTLGDNLRQLKFNLTAAFADLKYIRRAVMRELRYFIPIADLLILFFMITLLIIIANLSHPNARDQLISWLLEIGWLLLH